MEYFKTVVMGVSLPDRHEGYSSRSIQANVVLIDQADSGLDPLLYQLDKEKIDADLSLVHNGFVQLPKGAFLLIGHVHTIDRKNKLIHLAADIPTSREEIIQNSVSYNHLIIANGLEHSTSDQKRREEFSIGFQTLIDALKVQKKVPDLLLNPWVSMMKPQNFAAKAAETNQNPKTRDVAIDHMPKLNTFAPEIPKRNFELQL